MVTLLPPWYATASIRSKLDKQKKITLRGDPKERKTTSKKLKEPVISICHNLSNVNNCKYPIYGINIIKDSLTSLS